MRSVLTHPQTWAIARSDMLILEPEGKDAENINLGSTQIPVGLGFFEEKKHANSVVVNELALAA